MLFNSAIFLLFLAVLMPAYALVRGARARQNLLLVASYLFYAHWDWRYVALLGLSTLVDYVAAARMARAEGPARRRWLLASLVTNLGALGVFKYGRLLLGTAGLPFDWLPEEIPVGISFYTFQTMSYTIDVYRRGAEPCRSLREFALFVAFFPQLVAGPIVRATEFLPQLEPMPAFRLQRVAEGAQRFALGLFKKVVLADNVGLFVDSVFLAPGNHDALTLWCAAYGFALQIYCDFSAYTDMAIGVAHAFGFWLPENFDRPYVARSITEFWRRWHQSLSRWLRDYLYVPLGGNRISPARTYVNLMLTMLLGGLWHGAAWTFVLWGAWHGVLLAIERRIGVRFDDMARPRLTLGGVLRIVLTFHLVCIGWVMFRARGFDPLWQQLERMFTAWDGASFTLANVGVRWALVLAALVALQVAARRWRWKETIWQPLPAPAQACALALLLVGAGLLHVDEVAFIYFQF